MPKNISNLPIELIPLFEQLSSTHIGGRQLNNNDYFGMLAELLSYAPPGTLEMFLPLFFKLQGQPLTLKDHFTMSPLFTTDCPASTLFMNGRQTGKSVALGGSLIMRAIAKPNFSSLYITPLQEQVKRFSLNYMRELIDNSPFRSYIVGNCTQNIDYRSFANNSKIMFSFASSSADRIRGINADLVCFDEIQDFDLYNIPVISETLSASKWGIQQFTGTPKTIDNTIAHFWYKSSQAEWCIKCNHCNKINIPSMQYDLTEMIGPLRDDISEESPAIVCASCKKPLYPREGRWVHRFKDRRITKSGYHVPQIVLPLHACNRNKWATLLAKQKDYPKAQFINEVLGEPFDAGQTLVSQADMIAAGCLGFRNNPSDPDPEVYRRLSSYSAVVLSIDWGGGGQDLTSFTVIALMGINSDGNIDVLWGKRFTEGVDHQREAMACMHYINRFNPAFIVHDFTGAGALRETILIQSGCPLSRIFPVQYITSARGNFINYLPPDDRQSRGRYSVDKTRSLLYTVQSIKQGKLRFFEYDGGADTKNISGISTSLLDDFLALVEEKMTSKSSTDSYLIHTSDRHHSDFAQAVNIGCVALWHITHMYPNFAISALDTYQSYPNQLYGQ